MIENPSVSEISKLDALRELNRRGSLDAQGQLKLRALEELERRAESGMAASHEQPPQTGLESALSSINQFGLEEGPRTLGAGLGAATGLATGPMAPAAVPVLSAGGSMLGEYIGQQFGHGRPDLPAAERMAESALQGLLQEAPSIMESVVPNTFRTALKARTLGLTREPGAVEMQLTNNADELQRLQLAEEFGIPVTAAQRSPSQKLSPYTEQALRSTFGGGTVYHKFDVRSAEVTKEAIDDMLSTIINNPEQLSPTAYGLWFRKSIKEAKDGVGKIYDEVSNRIQTNLGENNKVDISKIRTTADSLIEKLQDAEAFGENGSAAVKILNKFRDPWKKLAEQGKTLEDISGMAEMVDEPWTWERLKNFRTLIFNYTDDPNLTVGKQALKKLNSEIHNAMQSHVQSVDPRMALEFRVASKRYRTVMETLDKQVIRTLRNKAADSPELVGRTILSPGVATTIQDIQSIFQMAKLSDKKKKVLTRGIMESLFNQAKKEEMPISNMLSAAFEKPADVERFWSLLFRHDRKQGKKFREFVKLIDAKNFTQALTKPGKGMGLIGVGQMAGGAYSMLTGDFQTAAGLFVVPAVLAYMATNPRMTNVGLRLAKMSPTNPAFDKLKFRFTEMMSRALREMRPVSASQGIHPAGIPVEQPPVIPDVQAQAFGVGQEGEQIPMTGPPPM